MADSKISGLSADNAPTTDDLLVSVNDPGGTPANKKVTVGNIVALTAGYVLQVVGKLLNTDAQTHYFGYEQNQTITVTTADSQRVYIPRAGTVTKIYGTVGGTNGAVVSNEASIASFRLNNTTDTTISSSIDLTGYSATNPIQFSNTGLSVAVVAGDYFQIKFVTPTWATNPNGNSFVSLVIYIQ